MNDPNEIFCRPPQMRESTIDEPCGPELDRRLQTYLHALHMPESLIETWVSRASAGGVRGGKAFLRLQAMLAEYWREQGGLDLPDDTAISGQLRFCRWLMPEAAPLRASDCQQNLAAFISTPPVKRQSMVPESWD